MTQRREDPERVVAEHAPTAQCLLRGGRIDYANAALADLFGVEQDTLEGRRFGEFVAESDVEDVVAELTAQWDGPLTLRFDLDTGSRRTRTIESRWAVADSHSRNDGVTVGDGDVASATSGNGVEVVDDLMDMPPLVGSLIDATERVELERESGMLESALEHLPMSIYFKDRQSRHERVSKHMLCQDADSVITNTEGKQHHHPDDVVGKTDFDIYSGAFVEGAIEEDQQVMDAEEPIVNQVTESTTNLGETFFSSTTKAPRYDAEGNVVGIVGVTMDVTDRMSSQAELERQNERMEEFTEVLTHDLRNPLTVASGYAAILDEEYDDPTVGKLEDSLERMAALISEIRSFVLEGRTVETPTAVTLGAVAADAWECVETREGSLAVDATHTISADERRVQQLLENLFRNAIEHGDEAVSVTVGDLDDGFYVADDGPGISEDDEPHVFERGFSTGEDSTGFGLAIVENIADAHDWTVAVTESEAGGARFEFHEVVRVEEDVTAND